MESKGNKKVCNFRLIMVKAVRPDKVKNAIESYIKDKLGKDYIVFPSLDINSVF